MVGRTILHYEVIEQLGSGGMGVVYRAKDLKLGRPVALKFLSQELTRDSEAEARFEREARTASALNHPNICTIYAIDEIDGQRFIVMELLAGRSLHEVIGRRAMPLDRVLAYGVQIADALDAAHSEGILHRDIKPANIFITRREQAKVLDFGLAKLSAAAREGETADSSPTLPRVALSVRGEALGTIGYMSPEQARAEPLDARSDLFSFGVVLYEMITGQQAFAGPSTAVVFDGILNRTPAPISLIATDIPPEMERIVSRTLQKGRDERYPSAAELRDDLERLRRARESGRLAAAHMAANTAAMRAAGDSGAAPAATASGAQAAPAVTRRLRPAAAAGIAALAIVAVAAIAGVRWFRGSAPAETPRASAVAPAESPSPVPAAPAEPSPGGVPSGPVEPRGAGGNPATAPATERAARELRTGEPSSESRGPAAAPSTKAAPSTRAAAPARRAEPGSRTAEHDAQSRGSAPAKADPVTAIGSTESEPARSSPKSAEAGATLLAVARAKYDTRLYDQALADLEDDHGDTPRSPAAPAAYLLMGQVYEQQSRPDDAMAAYVELRSRHAGGEAAAEATYRLAQLTFRSKRPDRAKSARDLLGAIPLEHPASVWAPRALAAKAALEAREKIKEPDSVLGAKAPAAVATNRTLTERYPSAPESELALWQLGEAYDDLERYNLAAAAFETLAARFPLTRYDAWWRAAEIYDRRLKNKDAARAAYGRVPSRSPNYRDAQRRLR